MHVLESRVLLAVLASGVLACSGAEPDVQSGGKADDPDAVAGCIADLAGTSMAARAATGYRHVLDQTAGGVVTTTTLFGDGGTIEQVTAFAEEGAPLEIVYVGGLGDGADAASVHLVFRTARAAEQRVAMVTESFNGRAFSRATITAPAADDGDLELWFQRTDADGTIRVDHGAKADRVELRHAVGATACFDADDQLSIDAPVARGTSLAVVYDPRRLLSAMADDGVTADRWTIDLIASAHGLEGREVERHRIRIARAGGSNETAELANAIVPVEVPLDADELDLWFEATAGGGELPGGPGPWLDDDDGRGFTIALSR